MKIKTITCHDVYNYGASLQAYALQQHLLSLGYDVEIIDYQPEYLHHSYRFWYIPKEHRFYNLCKKNKLFHFLYAIRLLPITYATWGRIQPFKKFKMNYLKCTSQQFHNVSELKCGMLDADVLIAGSDQIWNCNLPNGLDPSFYLNFGSSYQKRISYAASFAVSEIPLEYKSTIKSYLSALNAISVREQTGVVIANDLGYSATLVLDPVFLLSKEEWQSLAGPKPIIKENYLLVYHLFSASKGIPENALLFAKSHNLKIVSINDKGKRKYADINISDAGPIEFVNLIYYAKYVMADSFHATAFSIILNKPFSIYYHNQSSSRITDCLRLFGLSHCYNPQLPVVNIEWETVNHRLYDSVQRSKSFLNKEIQSNETVLVSSK